MKKKLHGKKSTEQDLARHMLYWKAIKSKYFTFAVNDCTIFSSPILFSLWCIECFSNLSFILFKCPNIHQHFPPRFKNSVKLFQCFHAPLGWCKMMNDTNGNHSIKAVLPEGKILIVTSQDIVASFSSNFTKLHTAVWSKSEGLISHQV